MPHSSHNAGQRYNQPIPFQLQMTQKHSNNYAANEAQVQSAGLMQNSRSGDRLQNHPAIEAYRRG